MIAPAFCGICCERRSVINASAWLVACFTLAVACSACSTAVRIRPATASSRRSMPTANRARGRFRQAEVLDLALLDQILDGPGDIFDGHIRIDAVLVIEIDRLDPQSRQRTLDH